MVIDSLGATHYTQTTQCLLLFVSITDFPLTFGVICMSLTMYYLRGGKY